MTVREFCIKYNIPLNQEVKVDTFIRTHKELKVKTNFLGNFVIDESNETRILDAWDKEHAQERESERLRREQEAEEEEFLRQEEERISAIVSTMPITSAANFEGYRIAYYGGYVSGDEATMLSDAFFGMNFNKDTINDAIKAIRVTAIEELKRAAAEVGCNAVIGLDFDYVTIDRQHPGLASTIINETYLILTANGTAVTIEELNE